MVELPLNYSDIIDLADWLELTALEAGDRNASAGDLTSALKIPVDDANKVEELSLEVMLEISRRADAAADAYPFEVKGSRLLQTKDDWEVHIAYVFCLCLSKFGWKPLKGAPINPWYLFEDLAAIAAKHYINGRVYKFGFEAVAGASGFESKVNELCRFLGEGGGYSKRPHLNRKDDKVDLVAWKDFADGRESKLIMFGQCAAGANWADKVSELRPDVFWKRWVREPEVSPIIRSFYVPFRIPHEEFAYRGQQSGILFDRCRIAHSVWSANHEVVSDNRYGVWCKSVFAGLAQL